MNNEILFEVARTIWVTENLQDLPDDPEKRQAVWRDVQQSYIGRARAILLQLDVRGVSVTQKKKK